jgi:hypothetical protein
MCCACLACCAVPISARTNLTHFLRLLITTAPLACYDARTLCRRNVLRIRRELLVDHAALERAAHQAAQVPPPFPLRTSDAEDEPSDAQHISGFALLSPPRGPALIRPRDEPREDSEAVSLAVASPAAASPAESSAEWEAMLREELECFSPHLPPTMRELSELDALLKSP